MPYARVRRPPNGDCARLELGTVQLRNNATKTCQAAQMGASFLRRRRRGRLGGLGGGFAGLTRKGRFLRKALALPMDSGPFRASGFGRRASRDAGRGAHCGPCAPAGKSGGGAAERAGARGRLGGAGVRVGPARRGYASERGPRAGAGGGGQGTPG